MNTGAHFSDCRLYRYRLWRYWDEAVAPATFIMLNPSTADEVANDPTVERCERRAREWGYGGLRVVNLFALRSPDPRALYASPDPIGSANDAAIMDATDEAGIVICAWGAHGKHLQRGAAVHRLLRDTCRVKPHALRINGDGTPAHPLYLPYSLKPQVML